QVQMT
ncbi:GAF domain protein, partial [Vibrio parahaemolyticus VP2007-007]